MEELRTELEAQHQASVNQMKSAWSKEREAEIHLQVKAQVAVAKAAWKEEQLKVRFVFEVLLISVDFSWCRNSFSVSAKMEKTWEQRLEEARRGKHGETAEATCQAEPEPCGGTVTVEELDTRLEDQREQLLLEADRVKHKAVEEARKQTQRQLHKKHLEDMAKQARVFFNFAVLLSSGFVGTQMCPYFRLKVQ